METSAASLVSDEARQAEYSPFNYSHSVIVLNIPPREEM
jgi:hypothetical protein